VTKKADAQVAAAAQTLLFQKLRSLLVRNTLRVLIQESPIRLATILLASLLIWGGLYAASAWGFSYLQEEQVPFSARIVGTLFDFLFVALALMLFFSTSLILYSSLFASPETAFLLTMPAAADQVFAYKFQGAAAFSSWAFLLLGAPVLIAYGVVLGSPWYFYALLPLFFLGFVLVPGAMGALACLLIVILVPRKRKQVLLAALAAIALLVVAGIYRLNTALYGELIDQNLIQQMYNQIGFARGPLMPSHWMTRGLQAAARGELAEAGYRLALIWSNGLFLYLVAGWLAGRCYRPAYDRMASGGDLRRRYGGAWLDRLLSGLVGFLDPQTRLLIVKDFRTFRRDPAQWAQVGILSGLLVLYFVNTRRFWQEQFSRPYQNGISLLNLIAVALLMCAYTGRFIYPLLSLEGRKFWVLGLLPMQRDRLLWGKFVFSVAGTLLVAVFLMTVSDLAIGMPPALISIHLLTVAVLALGLSGLSVGLGAILPNFRETDPSKIAIGFGGTMNLVACLLFLLLVIGVMALPWHVYAVLEQETELAEIPIDGLLLTGQVAGIGLGVLAVYLPMAFGASALRQVEF
jgi:ABC-2 type transport system permease protein